MWPEVDLLGSVSGRQMSKLRLATALLDKWLEQVHQTVCNRNWQSPGGRRIPENHPEVRRGRFIQPFAHISGEAEA